MADHVLVPIDGSDSSWHALDHALSNHTGGTITVLNVVDPRKHVYTDIEAGYYDPEFHDRALEQAEDLCDDARRRAEEAGILDTTVFDSAIETGRPARTIVEYAEDHDVDQVVMGSHGRTGVSRILLGSVAEDVVRRVPVPVTVVR